ncbi:MAG TPA: DUF3574 domain-containing protein, partial [Usitatibacter sp.]
MRFVLVVSVLVGLAGCASLPESKSALPCGAGSEAAVSDLLYFGTTKPGGTVSLNEWSDFLWTVVTPRFPNGFTAWQAYGQWKPDKGEIQRETSYVVSIVHPPGQSAEDRIHALIAEYKSRFKQESVLRVSTPACVAF